MRSNSKANPCPKQKRNVTLLFWVVWPLNSMKMPWYSACLLLFLFRINDKKGRLDENDFRYCHGIFSKVAFWKLLYHSYVQSSFPIITRHIENSILKDTLQLNIFRTWINLRATSFIKTSVNMKQKSMTVPRKRSVVQKSKCALRRKLNLSRPCFTYFIRLFFSQT